MTSRYSRARPQSTVGVRRGTPHCLLQLLRPPPDNLPFTSSLQPGKAGLRSKGGPLRRLTASASGRQLAKRVSAKGASEREGRPERISSAIRRPVTGARRMPLRK